MVGYLYQVLQQYDVSEISFLNDWLKRSIDAEKKLIYDAKQ